MTIGERWDAWTGGQRRAKAQAIFFRSLATLMSSGVHIVRGLEVLSIQTEHRPLARALVTTQKGVLSGQPLSRSLPATQFTRLHLRLVAVGERTGSLHRILIRMADEAERGQRLRMQVRSALSYPLFVMGAAIALAVLAENFIFHDFLANLVGQGIALPWSTRLLLATSNWVAKGSSWLWLALAVAWTWFAAVRWHWWRRLRPYLLAVPGLGKALRTVLAVEFVRALALCELTGVPLLEGLELACAIDPLLAPVGRLLKEEIKAGEPLHAAIRRSGFFPPLIPAMLEAGEESGKVSEMLERAARVLEESMSEALAAATAVLQPLLLLAVGLVVGFVVIATMSPMLKLVETL